MQLLTLNNGIKIPQLGFGVYQIPPRLTKKAVAEAIQCGYRLIDTAMYYSNEVEVGQAIRESGIKREEFYVTTKVFGARDRTDAKYRIESCLQKLDIGYIDLLLIHWPSGNNVALWQEMEEYVHKGLLKSIGLSNFYQEDLEKILKVATIKPVVNQIECHVYRQKEETQQRFESKGMIVEAWSPLACGKHNIFKDPVLKSIGEKYNKSNAQVALRYLIQRGIIVIAKSTHKERMEENKNVFDFQLTDEEISKIKTLDTGKSLFGWCDGN